MLQTNSMSADKKTPSARIALKRTKAKQEILDAALEILSNQGVESLTLAAVAEQLGFTKPALYYYIQSKEDSLRSLVLELLRQETAVLIAAVSKNSDSGTVLGTLIRAFYDRYRSRLNAFRLVYCQFQLMDVQALGFDQTTIRQDVNPLSKELFDTVVSIIYGNSGDLVSANVRRLAFSAWLAAVGLIEMIGIAEAGNDPLRYPDDVLLDTLEQVFNAAAERIADGDTRS